LGIIVFFGALVKGWLGRTVYAKKKRRMWIKKKEGIILMSKVYVGRPAMIKRYHIYSDRNYMDFILR
jgi:hypothetical protein